MFFGRLYFLSNFYPTKVTYDNEEYATSEHAYQALKLKNKAHQKIVRDAETPGMSKALSRKYPLRPDFEETKDELMFDIVLAKFTQNYILGTRLLRVKKKELIEYNTWHDNYWGDCICPDCAHVKGKNKLGKILKKVRKIIKRSRKCKG